ncbi:FAD-dependent monooxygenase [Salinibacterium sp. G-O1]|uniref:NAD(P)/FAD-dependent oxidoreductase n=1 Tax=Salinibacterium sp. G-O1 TaxID=3046208 RepID=UPI0024B880E6|nr:FAD-dependent monooxygenase [Salinibacterium sp. G-O1]MDJ0333659.1 FAD-dependent monooxygenase [Salinibacterium sp. G-O1]
MSADVDVVVVGGGPVGLAAAIEARLAGLTALVIEPRENTVDKACGEGLMPGALPLLARLGIDPPGMPLRGVSYLTPTRRADHLFSTGAGRGVRRTALHDALSSRAAELGVERTAGRIDAFTQDSDGVTVDGLRAGWLFGADGLHSTVRRVAGLEHPRAGARRYGLRQHFAVAPWSDMIEVHWAATAEIYVTPVAADTVGIAVLGRKSTDFHSTISGIPALAAHLDGAAAASSLRGAGPFRQRALRPSAGRVLLVGDASGYVDAVTGEGLRLGFEQARLAVEHVTDGIDYDRAWARSTRDFRRLTAALVQAATSPLRPAIVPAAVALPGVFGAVVERLAR